VCTQFHLVRRTDDISRDSGYKLFRRPQNNSTLDQIADDLCSLMSMVLRSLLEPVANFRLLLTPAQLETAQALYAGLNSSKPPFNLVHDMAYSLLTDCHPETADDKFECIQVRHIILSQLRAEGVFASPLAISSSISRKKWHMRATGTFEAYLRKDEFKRKMFGYVLQLMCCLPTHAAPGTSTRFCDRSLTKQPRTPWASYFAYHIPSYGWLAIRPKCQTSFSTPRDPF
jgi:hypothetical protein